MRSLKSNNPMTSQFKKCNKYTLYEWISAVEIFYYRGGKATPQNFTPNPEVGGGVTLKFQLEALFIIEKLDFLSKNTYDL